MTTPAQEAKEDTRKQFEITITGKALGHTAADAYDALASELSFIAQCRREDKDLQVELGKRAEQGKSAMLTLSGDVTPVDAEASE